MFFPIFYRLYFYFFKIVFFNQVLYQYIVGGLIFFLVFSLKYHTLHGVALCYLSGDFHHGNWIGSSILIAFPPFVFVAA